MTVDSTATKERLAEAIDDLIDCVENATVEDVHGSIGHGFTRETIQAFLARDQIVDELAEQLGLQLPTIDLLKGGVAADKFPEKPVEYEGYTHLPGDWDEGVFIPCQLTWREKLELIRDKCRRNDQAVTSQVNVNDRIPSQRFWDDASDQQKATMRLLLEAPQHRLKVLEWSHNSECFSHPPATNDTARKAVERLVMKLAKTTKGWSVDRSKNFDDRAAEIWLIQPETVVGQK